MPKGITPVKLKRLSGGRYTVSVSVPQRSRNMDCEFSVPTSNRFNLLAPTDPAAPQGTLKLPKLDKPEHFIVLRENISKLANIPELVGLYNWKRLRNGDLKLFPASPEAAEKIKVEVDKLGWYSQPSTKEYKYVAYGLSPMKPEELITRINTAAAGRLTANHVSRMTIKNPLYPDQCNYLVYFAQNPTLPTLRETINNIDGAIPSWAHYRNNKNGERNSRCTNCQKPHHGNRGCQLPPACGVCAQAHKTPQCPLLIEKRAQNKARIDTDLLKCANCGGKHTAGYPGCNFMQKPVQISRSRQWAQQHVATPIVPATQQLNVHSGNFPQLPRPKQSQASHQTHHQANQSSTNHQTNNVIHGSSNSNLFSLQELQLIMSDIMSKLRDC